MNRRALNIAMSIVFVFMMAAFFVASNQESQILRSRQFTPTANQQKPIEVKGQIYFVSDRTSYLARGSKYSFLAGVFALVLLIAAAKRVRD